MILSGEDGETKPVKLVTTRDKPFQIGQTDVFDVSYVITGLAYLLIY